MPTAAPEKPRGRIRWIVCALLFAAVALSYIDRLVLPTLKPELQARYRWTEQGYADLAIAFQAAYGLAYILFGRFVDRVGAKVGYAVAVTLWTIGHVAHALFTSAGGMIWARLPLAVGEAGAFPAALAAANAWFPQRERALAIGIFNAGSNVGAILTPLIVPAIAVAFGWRMAFIATGALTLLWLAAWLAFYRSPAEHRRVTAEELAWIEQEEAALAHPVAWRTLLRLRQTWAYVLGRFLIDPIWWTFLFWLPDFFNRQYGVRMLDFGPPLVAVYLLADVGSLAGGWFSSRLLARGASVNRARKTAMAACAILALPIIFAAHAPGLWWAVLAIGLACACHQGFSANVYAIPGDLFPRGTGGSVIGLGGLAGALGGMAMAKFAGTILAGVGGYGPIFAVAGCAYFAALLVIHLLIPRYAPVAPERLP
uniref:MFS transporter n=1 Tax=Sphingomonas sp. NY01 TaxID=2968057 RepID=UPI00406C1CC1